MHRVFTQLIRLKKTPLLLGLVAVLGCVATVAAHAAGCDNAGNCYVRAGATGAGTGANWSNAYAGFGTGAGQVDPSRMQRGVTYWIASGSYGGINFSTADSGSSVITIEGATAANHGPASDWNDSYAGQAVFGESSITSDNWVFNGQTRGSDWQSGYTLKFWNQSDPQGFGVALGTYQGGVSNISFSYVEMEGTGNTGGAFPNNSTADRCSSDNCGQWMDGNLYEVQPCSNIYIGYGYYHHTGNSQFWFNDTGNGGTVSSNLTWEYNWVSYNHTGQNGQHDEAYSLLGNNVTIRHNVFQDISGTGLISDASAANPAMSNWYVYGNIFFNDQAYLALGQQYWLNTMDNGILAFGDGNGNPENLTGTILFANNTIANWNPAGVSCANNVYSTLPVSGVPGAIAGSAQVTIANNLWYNAKCAYGNYASICYYLNCSEDYNASYAGGITDADNWQTQSSPAAHDVNVSGSTDPFVNADASTIAGFALATPDPFVANPGTSLGSPYDVDMLGVSRGANGTWDRGALQLGTSSPTATLQSIAVTPAKPSIQVNGTQQFTATGTYSDNTTKNLTTSVTWNSSNTGVASIGSGGVATGVASGNSTISAASGSVSGSTTLTVTAAQPTLQSIAVTPTASSLTVGGTQQFTATATYSDGSTKDLSASATWSSSNAAVVTVSAAGLAKGVAAGSATVRAVSGSVSGSASVTVSAAQGTLQSITVTPANPSIAAGAHQQLTATGSYSDGSTKNLSASVTWSSSNASVATVSTAGLANGVAAGNTTIRATSGSISGSITLTVTAAKVTLQSITLSPASSSIVKGASQQFTATGIYSDGSSKNLNSSVSWSSSNAGVASISASGLATGVAAGATTISVASGTVSSQATLRVTASKRPTLQSIAVRPASVTLHRGRRRKLNAFALYSNGSRRNVSSSVTWSSSDSASATVGRNGLVIARGPGSAVITATLDSSSGSASVTITP